MEFSKEQLKKAKTAKSAEELMALAKDEGIVLAQEEAERLFAQWNTPTGELADEELTDVAGGGCGGGGGKGPECYYPVGTHVMQWRSSSCAHYVNEIGGNFTFTGNCPSTYWKVVRTKIENGIYMYQAECPLCRRCFPAGVDTRASAVAGQRSYGEGDIDGYFMPADLKKVN